MTTRTLFAFIISMVFSSCGSNKESKVYDEDPEYPVKIDLVKAMSNSRDIKLSEIADSIVYIPLQYVENNPVGYIGDFLYFADNIFVHVYGSEQKFLRFNAHGKFLNMIGTMGRGPDEYTGGSVFSAIDVPERVYILNNLGTRRLLEFDYDGNFLANVFTAFPEVGPVEAITDDKFLFLSGGDILFHYLAVLCDRNNRALSKVAHPLLINPKYKNIQYLSYTGAVEGHYFQGDPLFWDELSMDTIFSVSGDSIYARYVLDKGKKGAPFEITYSNKTIRLNTGSTPERWNYLLPTGFTETTRDIYITALYNSKELYIINYNKGSHILSSIKTPLILPDDPRKPVTVAPKFENDIDGGLSTGPGKPNKEGDVWTYHYEAIEFKNMLNEDHFQNSKALMPEKKKALMQLVDTLDEYDNPVIVAIYLKK